MGTVRRVLLWILVFLPLVVKGQEVLTLDKCRSLAVENSRDLSIKRTEIELAGYDRKIAMANYFPSISATGAYMWHQKPLQMISDERIDALSNLGTNIQGGINEWARLVQDEINSRPDLFAEYIASPLWQKFMDRIADLGIAGPIDQIGQSVAKEFMLDIRNVYLGVVSLTQPIFAGGKIVLANQAARLAEELAREQYGMQYADIIVDVDAAYWQIVSIAGKKRLAEAYSDLLQSIQKDVEIAVGAGVATASDALSVKVKAGEAELMLNKATNGLALAKMLLCKRTGLPLDSEIVLEDEESMLSPQPEAVAEKDLESILSDRPETRSLALAGDIYDKKAGMARADMLPQVGLTANYMLTNPNMYHGFQNKFGGAFSVGIMVKIPIFHGFEALQKYRRAKAEASLYRERYQDAREMISLQVSQCSDACDQALQRVKLSSDYLESARENLSVATAGFEAGTIDTRTLLSAQTAWLQAGTEAIDASVELRLATSNLLRAQGELRP